MLGRERPANDGVRSQAINPTMSKAGVNPQSAQPGRTLRTAVVGVCALVALSGAWGLIDAVRGEPRVWGLLGFEVVTLAAAVLGVLVGMGRPREAPGLGVACVAATIFAAATLGRFSAIVTRSAETVSEGQAVGLLLRDPVFEGRAVAAIVLGAIAVCFALGGNRAAWKRLAIGAGLLVPVVAASGWALGPGMGWLIAPVESFGGVVRVVVALIGGVVLTLVGSVGVHQVIGAFEASLPPLEGVGAGRKPAAPAPKNPA